MSDDSRILPNGEVARLTFGKPLSNLGIEYVMLGDKSFLPALW